MRQSGAVQAPEAYQLGKQGRVCTCERGPGGLVWRGGEGGAALRLKARRAAVGETGEGGRVTACGAGGELSGGLQVD